MPQGSDQDGALHDLAIIGGGVNGCGIARDAQGRGWSVALCEQHDLGGATSAASTKLIHGGLRYLEHREFRLVREALRERETIWGIAPHIVWPLRFVLPHQRGGLRPAWMLRLGLFLYDHLGGRRRLPATRTVRLRDDPVGAPLRPELTLGFEYSDCWVEDSRLVVLNARDAAARGALVLPRHRAVSATREGDTWRLRLQGPAGPRELRARALVNAAGPWVSQVLGGVLGSNAPARVRLVKGSHVVVPRLYDGEQCYIFQNADRRIIFAIPYERDFTLLGTTDEDFSADPGQARASEAEVDYICRAVSDYFARPVTPADVVWSYAGVRPLYDDGSGAAQEATRDYVLRLEEGGPPLLSVFGGKITTYRKLAEDALRRLSPLLPAPSGLAAGWTGGAALPGGDFPVDGFDALVARTRAGHPYLPEATARRLVRAYGTRVAALLGEARSMADLGRDFGAGLTEAELRYLVCEEWATTAADVVWRRSKLGLRLSPAQVAAVEDALRALLPQTEPAA